MEDLKSNNYSRRSFLKSSALAGGGLMISFSAFSKFRFADRINSDLPEQWYEITGYVKIMLIFLFLSCQGFSFPNSAALSLAPFTKEAAVHRP